MKSYACLKTRNVGDLLLVATETHLVGIYFSDHQNGPKVADDWEHNPGHPLLRQGARELKEYLGGRRTTFNVPLAFEGTEFQKEVWKQIARIPFGETITYTELAERAGAPTALRAAGTATGRNPLSIVVPCHRVVGKNGGLGGYAGGLDRKKSLLQAEASRASFKLAAAGK
jgi:methylated-DNA-[protein]-cysteine S-methyltransferase